MCAEDAKKMLQGGLLFVSQKNRAAKRIVYNSGYYMTTNQVGVYSQSL